MSFFLYLIVSLFNFHSADESFFTLKQFVNNLKVFSSLGDHSRHFKALRENEVVLIENFLIC